MLLKSNSLTNSQSMFSKGFIVDQFIGRCMTKSLTLVGRHAAVHFCKYKTFFMEAAILVSEGMYTAGKKPDWYVLTN